MGTPPHLRVQYLPPEGVGTWLPAYCSSGTPPLAVWSFWTGCWEIRAPQSGSCKTPACRTKEWETELSEKKKICQNFWVLNSNAYFFYTALNKVGKNRTWKCWSRKYSGIIIGIFRNIHRNIQEYSTRTFRNILRNIQEY